MDTPYLISFEKMGSPEIGYLSVAQYEEHLPFDIKRVFWNYGVPDGVERGNHAYLRTRQVLIALHGRVEVSLESKGGEMASFILQHPAEGLYVPPHYWRRTRFFDGGILAVFSSHVFDPADNLRDYQAFRQ
jgi:hypothetical protein